MAILGERDTTAEYTATYTTFSGADITASFNGTTIGTLAGITWSVSREKAPIFTLGSPNPRSFSRGKRGIAGSMVFTTFDRAGLYNLIRDNLNNDTNARIYTRSWNVLQGTNGALLAANIAPIANAPGEIVAAVPYYADQLLPFDITIMYANEYGQAAVRRIYGVELLNEGSGASMDDIVIEETMTFVAREVGPMIPTNREFTEPYNIDEKVVNAFGLG